MKKTKILAKKAKINTLLPAILVFICLFCTPLSAKTNDLTSLKDNNLSLQMIEKTFAQVFEEIKTKTDYVFFFRDDAIDLKQKVSIDTKDLTVEETLNTLFASTGNTYKIEGRQIFVSKGNTNSSAKSTTSGVSQPQQAATPITGIIQDVFGEPLIGVSVIIKGTTTGTMTNTDGAYSINATPTATLVFSFIGFNTQEILVGDTNVHNIILKEDDKQLDEVIVTALGIKRSEKALGYSVQKISGDALQVVKGTNIATSLTGKIAGMTIKNSTELREGPELTLRGKTPLMVIDGVPYSNMKLKDLAPEDIESIDILKGATASALYGSRGENGAVMITTKRGKDGKVMVNVSNNTMFNAGFLKIPKTQSSYASGAIKKVQYNGVEVEKLDYDADYVWGAYMDGRDVLQYDGISKDWRMMPLVSRGKNNMNSYLENSYVTTSNANISQSTDHGSFRVSLSHAKTKGQIPGSQLSKYNAAAAGTIKFGNLTADASLSIGKEDSPNLPDRVSYGKGNPVYMLSLWTGTDFDVRDFKDYWLLKDESQNFPWTAWYDNPYFLAHEHVNSSDRTIAAGSLNLNYDFSKYLKAQFRTGYDQYSQVEKTREAVGGFVYNKTGYFQTKKPSGWSWTNDLILMSNFKVSDFQFDVLGGLGSYYYYDHYFTGTTNGGLAIPGFYSLKSSKDPATVSTTENAMLLYSAYTKLSTNYKTYAYLDLTGRNDWASTLPKGERSFFYPSAALSFVPSEIYNPISDILTFWKLRASWTMSKKPPAVYETNLAYTISSNVWDGLPTAGNPKLLNNDALKPITTTTWEFGTDFRFLNGRLRLDYAYFRNRTYNRIVEAAVSKASGYEKMRVNIDEDRVVKGMEFTVSGTPITNSKFEWNSSFNIGFFHTYYNNFDEQYSSSDPRIKKGGRVDRLMTASWQIDAEGNMILSNAGKPLTNPYSSLQGYTDPKFVFGFTNEFKISDFTVAMSIDGRVGGIMWARTNQAMWHTGTHPDSDNEFRYNQVVKGENYIAPGMKVVSGKLVADQWGNIISDDRKFAPNDIAINYIDYAKAYHSGTSGDSGYREQHLADPTFIKLRELAVNYTLPRHLTKKFACDKVVVGLIGQNLLMWTKSKQFKFSDPDRGKENMNSPSFRTIGFNVNLTF